MILHSIITDPTHSAFTDCLRLVDSEDALILQGDGVYAALNNSDSAQKLTALGAKLYVLEDDAKAAGVTSSLHDGFQLASFEEFVSLTEHYPKQMAWF